MAGLSCNDWVGLSHTLDDYGNLWVCCIVWCTVYSVPSGLRWTLVSNIYIYIYIYICNSPEMRKCENHCFFKIVFVFPLFTCMKYI
jgi:hypothetical protein